MNTTATTPTSGHGGDELDRRRRLDQLIITRERLAVTLAAFEAHRLGDGEEIARVLWAVEATVHAEFPARYGQLFNKWLARDAALRHDSSTPTPQCPICGPGNTTPRRVIANTPTAA